MATIRCRQAFEWTCEECGLDHFGRLVAVEMSEEDEKELKERLNLEKGYDANFYAIPKEVTCTECGNVFQTIDDYEIDE